MTSGSGDAPEPGGGPEVDRRPSPHLLMVPVLLGRGFPPAQVAELTEVPVALVDLIAAESDTAQPAQPWRSGQEIDIATPPSPVKVTTRKVLSDLEPGDDAAAMAARRMSLWLLIMSVLTAAAAATSVLAHRPALGAIAFTGSAFVLAVTFTIAYHRNTRRRRRRSR